MRRSHCDSEPPSRGLWSRNPASVPWTWCTLLLGAATVTNARAEPDGRDIYASQCAACHGEQGEGVADQYDEALYGNRSLDELTRIIEETMPEEDPETCVGDDAKRVATYIYGAFYTAEARAKSNPPRVELVRLTVPQYRNAIADLLGAFAGGGTVGEGRGLQASYYKSRNLRRNERVFERVDDSIDFDFGEGSPDSKIGAEEFSIKWEGSIIADEAGEYEFGLRSENGFRLWVNDQEDAFIDGWVSSGTEPREQTRSIHLLAGRAYPIRIDFFKFKDKTASIELRWKPPHKTWTMVPRRHLATVSVPATFVVATPFPPDDASVGYERGTAVSPDWDAATTSAALETVGFIDENLRRFTGANRDDPERVDRFKSFCRRFAGRAFRRPLTDEQNAFFVERQFSEADSPEEAVKRSLLLVLKSPRFLYLDEFSGTPVDDYDLAARLSFALWDSLPDELLLSAADQGQLHSREAIERQAQRMLHDPRTGAKLRSFFHAWLQFNKAAEIAKDAESFPGFDEELVADLRTSLDLFIDDVVWSEGSDYRRLLLAADLFVNGRLAAFYETAGERDAGLLEFEKVSLDPAQRAGVITHPYLLSALAYHKSTSPIHRGVFLTRHVLSRSLNPPPMAIEFPDGGFDPQMTMREKVAELTRPAACQTCHRVINPLGFSLESFDAVGRFRTTENDRPVDVASLYTTPEGETVKLEGARDLAEFAAADESAQLGFVEQLFHHTVKQPAAAYGSATLIDLRRQFAADEFNMQDLLVNIATTCASHGLTEK